MKKITLFLALIGMITLNSCTTEETYIVDDANDKDTISEVWEYTNVNFYPADNYSVVLDFPYTIYTSDMVLVYRLSGYSSATGDIWKLLPETYYFDDGTLDFGFNNDFTVNDTQINLIGYDLANLNSDIRLGQVIRVVVIPAFFGKSATPQVDFNDYNAVIDYYQLKGVTKIQ